jgi:hypothetical protein
MLQFSLRNLLIAVAFCAFGAAALVNANPWWLAISWSAALLSLATAGLLAVHRREAGVLEQVQATIRPAPMYSISRRRLQASVLCLNSLSYHNR